MNKVFSSLCFHSKLVINQIIPEDDGIYQCEAENEQGSVLAMARLIVVMSDNRPSAPRNTRADTVSSSAILLAWERPVYNSDKVIAYSVHYMKAEGERLRYKLWKLKMLPLLTCSFPSLQNICVHFYFQLLL